MGSGTYLLMAISWESQETILIQVLVHIQGNYRAFLMQPILSSQYHITSTVTYWRPSGCLISLAAQQMSLQPMDNPFTIFVIAHTETMVHSLTSPFTWMVQSMPLFPHGPSFLTNKTRQQPKVMNNFAASPWSTTHITTTRGLLAFPFWGTITLSSILTTPEWAYTRRNGLTLPFTRALLLSSSLQNIT
jgi:hypothetical protein